MFLLSELFFSSSETTLSSATKQLPMVVYLLLLVWEVWTIRFQWAPQDQDEDPEVVPALLGWMWRIGGFDWSSTYVRSY